MCDLYGIQLVFVNFALWNNIHIITSHIATVGYTVTKTNIDSEPKGIKLKKKKKEEEEY